MFFNPDPYVKLSVQPGNRASLPRLSHHGQHMKTSIQANTTNPDWATDEVRFSFTAYIYFMRQA